MRSFSTCFALLFATVAVAQPPAKPVAAPAPPATLAKLPAAQPATMKLAVYPPDINLETSRDRQSFVVQLTQPDGITRDVTDLAQVSLANAALAKLDKNVLLPLADGTTEM